MAVQRVEQLLRKVAKALNAGKIDYAVVGGNAVAAWVATVDEGAVRATKDVDILIRREDFPLVSDRLRPTGLIPIEVLGVSMFVQRRRPNPKTGVHLLFANEKVRSHDHCPVPDPSNSVRARGGFRVIELLPLVVMKLQAYRLADRTHLADMLALRLITRSWRRRIPQPLRARWDALLLEIEA